MSAEPPSPRPLSRIVMLVHPLYSLIHSSSNYFEDHQRLSLALSRKNVDFLLGRWGEQIVRASKNPETLAIIITYDFRLDSRDLQKKLPVNDPAFLRRVAWVEQRLARFYAWIERAMGGRSVFVANSVRDLSIRRKIFQEGFVLSPRWRGKAFGEYLTRCVEREVQRALWIIPGGSKGLRSIARSKNLSLRPLNPQADERIGLGNMREDLPKKVRTSHIRIRNGLRRKRKTTRGPALRRA